VAERTNQYATKMKCGRKTANINTKKLRGFITVKTPKTAKII